MCSSNHARSAFVFAILFGFVWSNECRRIDNRALPIITSNGNAEPIIGVLTLEVSPAIKRNFPLNQESYIAASYVKFVEGAGGKAAPIWIGRPRSYYEDIMSKVNGVLLPGGATFFNNTNGYADAGRMIYEIAIKMNEKGTYIPIWGTCLGFELLLYAATNGREHRTFCNSMGQTLPLELKKDIKGGSRLFSGASNHVLNILSTKNVTYNWHMYCTTQETFHDLNLDEDWQVLSTNEDWNGEEFISSVEHKKYPIYGVQFHPEKNLYEWSTNKNLTHTQEAVKASQYFADFFVNECRKNTNKFPTELEKFDTLIYNYSPTFTGRAKSAYYQMYFFEKDATYGRNSEIFTNLV